VNFPQDSQALTGKSDEEGRTETGLETNNIYDHCILNLSSFFFLSVRIMERTLRILQISSITPSFGLNLAWLLVLRTLER
jgi:hypothetical protein